MLGLGWPEAILVFVILLFIFGPKKLPEMARELGKALREFNKASSDMMEDATAPPPKSDDLQDEESNALIAIAKKLNINTEGKTIKQISEEVTAKIGVMNKGN